MLLLLLTHLDSGSLPCLANQDVYIKATTRLIYLNMTQKQSIPNTLRFHRKQAGLRQLDVARSLGFQSTDRISHWEKGQTYPHLENLFKLSALYKVPPQELYGEVFKTLESRVHSQVASPPEDISSPQRWCIPPRSDDCGSS
jgi:transcriptional regulator with XRE-family HTH domain